MVHQTVPLTQSLIVLGSIAMLLLNLGLAPGSAQLSESIEAQDVWTRGRRMSICDSDWQVRDPSLLRSPTGDVIAVFTRISEQQQQTGTGDLVAVRSEDSGVSWSDPVVVYSGDDCQPNTRGTVTALASGRMVGFVVAKKDEDTDMRLIASEDDGQSWRTTRVTMHSPLVSMMPYGKIIQIDGQLVVPISGRASAEGEEVSEVGLLRSSNGGRTWTDYSPIMQGREGQEMAYKEPAVAATKSGRLIALVAGKCETVPLYQGWTLFRAASDDGGRSWTQPKAVLIGQHPCLLPLPTGDVACAEVQYAGAYAWLRFQTSTNDLRTWQNYQECWGIRYFRHEGFVGRPALLALDKDTILAAFSRTRWTGISGPGCKLKDGLPLWTSDGAESSGTAIDQERIAGLFFKRTQRQPMTSAQLPGRIPRWQWVEDRSVFPPGTAQTLSGIEQTRAGKLWALLKIGETDYVFRTSDDDGQTWSPPQPFPQTGLLEKWKSGHSAVPGLGTITRSGRWIVTLPRTLTEREGYNQAYIGSDEDGYGIWQSFGERWKTELYVLHSDDQGKTWKGLDKPIDAAPLNQAICPVGTIYEEPDGTLVMKTFGSRTAEDVYQGLAGVVLFRSHDGGLTWGDPTVVAYGTSENGYRFSENDFVVTVDGTWIMLARLHERHRIHGNALKTMRMASQDRGRTWSKPHQVFTGGHPELAMLPDGGLVCASSVGLSVSYDLGRSWTQRRTYPNSRPLVLSDGTLMLIGGDYYWEWTEARILRKFAGL